MSRLIRLLIAGPAGPNRDLHSSLVDATQETTPGTTTSDATIKFESHAPMTVTKCHLENIPSIDGSDLSHASDRRSGAVLGRPVTLSNERFQADHGLFRIA